MGNTNYLLSLFVITLSLISWSSASEHMILFSDRDKRLIAEYGDRTTSDILKLDFYECSIDDISACLTRRQTPQKYVNSFSASERQECNNFQQVAPSMNDVLKFCVDMGNASWYGGPETTYQYWPLNKFNWTDVPYVTNEDRAVAALESYFFNSEGFYIHIDESVALFVDINGPHIGKMCFTAKVLRPYRKSRNVMQFRVCKFSNAREAHENAIKDFLGKPNTIPDPYIIKNPIWSTWARYKGDVNTTSVYGYAQEIVRYGYPKGTFEIDDNWESCYGSAQFNTSRFENMKGLVSRLKSDGFKTSLWTHPFVNVECDKHQIGESRGYFVRNTSNISNTNWWNGKGSYVDFTNPEAATWWANDLRTLLATSGIDTLKFDAGESSWVPPPAVYYDNDLTYYPDNIVYAYLKTISPFGDGIEYRTSRRSQEFGRFLRLMDRESRWGFSQGLSTLITCVLQLNMIGYPFVLPDMIGGNGYNNEPPSKEMYIRWMEANVFLPAVQFSYTPWDYDQQTVDVCKQLMDLRSKHTDTIIQLMRNSVSNGSPLNPPVWWIDPTDPVAQTIDDEYLLGETILVAPVLVEHAISRDVYLPAGLWRDENNPNSPLINGRTWLRNYPAYLNVLPWFTKVGEVQQSSNSILHLSSIVFILASSLIVYMYR